MKTLDDFLDLMLLIVVLGAFLPFTFRALDRFDDRTTVATIDDKTAQVLEGDTADIETNSDAMSAYEVIYMILGSNTTRIKYKKVLLPNDYLFEVKEENNYNGYVTLLKSLLYASKKYQLTYDYNNSYWRVYEV